MTRSRAVPPPDLLRIRLPANRLQIDEEQFLSLLEGCVSLLKAEKRQIIAAVARMSQAQADELIELMADELEDVRRSAGQWQTEWERIRQLQAQWWQELARELSH